MIIPHKGQQGKLCPTIHRLLISILICISISLGYAQRQTENSFKSKFGPEALVGYYAYVPQAYKDNPNQKFPIMIFLHGMGEKVWNPKNTNQLNKVKTHGPPRLIEQGWDFPFIVISPQCPFSSWDEVTTDNFRTSVLKPGEFVDEIIEKMKTLYRVDESRIYLTGLSMGGAGTWSYAMRYPEKIAAAIPIAGWIDNSDLCNISRNDVAVWAFQGQFDGGIGILGTITRLNACNLLKPVGRATIYPGVGHDSWTRTYDNTATSENIYNWLMRQVKVGMIRNVPPTADAGGDQSLALPTSSITLRGIGNDTDGEVTSYVWEQISGPLAVMSGTDSETLTLQDLNEGTYVFRFTVQDDAGASTSDEVTVTVKSATYVKLGGFKGEYFSNINLTGNAVERIDTTINFDWKYDAPHPEIGINRFSVRWTAKLKPEADQLYTFYTLSDDGVRLWVDGQLLIDNWTYHGVTENSGSISLKKGKQYDLKMEYFESAGNAVAKLLWSSETQEKKIISATSLVSEVVETVDSTLLKGLLDLQVYPLPAVNEVELKLYASEDGYAEVKVVDDFSFAKLQQRIEVKAGYNTIPLDLSNISSGIYNLLVMVGSHQERSKLVIVK